jgi:hypothetical protein
MRYRACLVSGVDLLSAAWPAQRPETVLPWREGVRVQAAAIAERAGLLTASDPKAAPRGILSTRGSRILGNQTMRGTGP